MRATCSQCGEELLEEQGDPWAFVVIFDRIFLLVLLGIVYFRFGPPSTWGLALLFAAITGLFVYTTPPRFGICLGIVYWARVRGSDCG